MPYLAALCYAIFLAFLADQAIAGEGGRRQLLRLVASVVILAGVSAGLGYLGKSHSTSGFGVYSMNLAAPFVGREPMGRFCRCHGRSVRGVQLSGGWYTGAPLLHLVDGTEVAGEAAPASPCPDVSPCCMYALCIIHSGLLGRTRGASLSVARFPKLRNRIASL